MVSDPALQPRNGPSGSRRSGDPTSVSPGDEGSDGRADDLPLGVVFEILSNQRRRFIITYLANESATTSLGDLAEWISSIENGKPEDALSSAERKRVYIALYQVHLPKLDDADVVDFDDQRKTVDAGPNLSKVLRYRESNNDSDDPDPVMSLGLSIVFLFFVVIGASLGMTPWLTAVLVGAFLTSVIWTVMAHVRWGR